MPVIERLPPTTALIVVDVQAGTLPNARSVAADDLIPRISQLIDAFRRSDRIVNFVVSSGTTAGATEHGPGGRVWPEGFADLAPGIENRDDEPVYSRAGWSAFAGTPLARDFGMQQITDVVIVGLATTFGVESTARAAADLGFNAVIVVDAVSDPDPEGHERSVTRVFPTLGRTATTHELVGAL